MALADIEADLVTGVPHKTCAVCHYISERGEAWGERLHRLLANRGIKFKDLAERLESDPDEPPISSSSLSRHAQNGCAARVKLR